MPADAKTIAVTAAGFVLVYSGIKGIKISTTFRDLLTGKDPSKETDNETTLTPLQEEELSTVPGTIGSTSTGPIGMDGPTYGGGNYYAPPAKSGATKGSRAAIALAFCVQQLGKPYAWGGAGPNSWDCSGLMMVACSKAGLVLPHSANAQWLLTQKWKIEKTTTPPAGSLVFFSDVSLAGPVTHVGMADGGDTMIEAPHTGDVVKYYSIAEEAGVLHFVGVTNPLGAVKKTRTRRKKK